MKPNNVDPKEQAFVEQALAAADRAQRWNKVRIGVATALLVLGLAWFASLPSGVASRGHDHPRDRTHDRFYNRETPVLDPEQHEASSSGACGPATAIGFSFAPPRGPLDRLEYWRLVAKC
jgi:hypothetical protein